jgi:hypothetical protein
MLPLILINYKIYGADWQAPDEFYGLQQIMIDDISKNQLGL